jgi:hypothetical protein
LQEPIVGIVAGHECLDTMGELLLLEVGHWSDQRMPIIRPAPS